MDDPFRKGGPVTGEFFTDRVEEVRAIARAMKQPAARLLVFGPRRMGKSSCIAMARLSAERAGVRVVSADLSTASTPADVANRLLQSASRVLWKAAWQNFTRRLASVVPEPAVTLDEVTGMPVFSLRARVRRENTDAQFAVVEGVLDTFDEHARAEGMRIAVVLDEFQEIHALGGEEAEWRLRSVIQRHEGSSYVLAGSREELIREMTAKKRAFFELLDPLYVGPIEPVHFSRWIDSRLESHGVAPAGAGAAAVEVSGPRTRDVLVHASAIFELGRANGRLTEDMSGRAFESVIDARHELYLSLWETLPAGQQNVLRALAASEESPFTEDMRERFGLGPSGSVAGALDRLIERDLLIRREGGYAFDSPFFRRWVERTTLPDSGVLPRGV